MSVLDIAARFFMLGDPMTLDADTDARAGRVGRLALVALALLAGISLAGGTAVAKKKHKRAVTLDRPTEPVVLTGAQVPQLLGTAPDSVVAFRFKAGKRGKARWIRVPVQVDERAQVDFGVNPPGPPAPAGVHTVYGTAPIGATALQYTDPNTFVGPDPDPTLDANDEVAFMAADAGQRASGKGAPKGVAKGGGTRIVVADPLTGAKRWIFLFRSRAGRSAAAATDYVQYSFRLLSGDYMTTYHRNAGPNPEASTIGTRDYTAGFSDRWFFDTLSITAGGAGRPDILDGYKFAFQPGSCGRSEATFNAAEGAFVVNKDGPVRAIRSYIGANSGPDTQRTHFFYQGREVIVTDLRVHPIPSLHTETDLSPAAVGMTYYDQQHPGGARVDGVPETLGGAPSAWHLWQGPQGSLFSGDRVDSSFKDRFLAAATPFYLDNSSPPIAQCWGDSQQIGAAGITSIPSGGIPATFPGPDYLKAITTDVMSAPGQTPAQADLLSRQLDAPLTATIGRFKR